MKKLFLVGGVVLALIGPLHAADTMPDALIGYWYEAAYDNYADESHLRAKDPITAYEGYVIEKDKYEIMDFTCTVQKVKKLAETFYTIQARCFLGDVEEEGDEFTHVEVNEFEILKNGRLLITPVLIPTPSPHGGAHRGTSKHGK